MSRLSYKSLILILLFLLIPIVLFLRINQNNKDVYAGWWDDSWSYRVSINIGNSSGADLTNQYVKISLDTSSLITSGKLQSDCDDLRVTNQNGNLLPHFLDGSSSYACNTSSTSIYVLSQSFPNNDSSLYIYYGNSSAPNIEPTIGTETNPAPSCKLIKNHGDGNSDGIYFLTLSGNTADKIQAYCNMTVDSGGWTLIFQRRGGSNYDNVDTCQANLNSFLRNSCGSITSLNYGDSYSIDLDNISNFGQFLLTQFDTNMTNDTDDTFIINSSNNIFPDSTGVNNNIAVTSVCDYNNSNCDTTDVYFKYIGDGWYGSAYCNGGYSTGSYLGNYGYCQNGVSTVYTSNGLFGNRNGYSETKLWNHSNGADAFMEKVYLREDSYSFSALSATPQSEEIGGGPIAYWKFDEGVGTTVYDSSAQNNTGIFSGAPQWNTEDMCVSEKCLFFNGGDSSGDLIYSSNGIFVGNTGAFTVSAWVNAKKAPTTQGRTAVSTYKYNSAIPQGWNFGTVWVGNYFGLEVYNGAGNSANANYSNFYDQYLNQWVHVTGVYKPSQYVYLYINGKLAASDTSSVPDSIVYPDNTIRIGRRNTETQSYWNGLIDEVKIYPYARTPAQIKADYASGLAGMGSSSDSSVNIGGASLGKSLSDGLVGYWKFDEGVGTTTADSSGNNQTGIFIGSTTPSWSSGKYGSGLYFNGTTSYVQIGTTGTYNMGSNNFSVSAWFNTNAYDQNKRIVSNRAPSNIWYEIYTDNSRIHMAVTDNYSSYGQADASCAGINNGTWYQVTGIWNWANKRVDLYLNGTLCNSATNLNITNPISPNDYLKIGYYAGTTYWDGLIDEVRIYNRALSPTEVRQLADYAPGTTSKISDPIAHYKFDEGFGSTTANWGIGGTSLNGTLGAGNSSPSWTIGKNGKALSFNGTSNFISIANNVTINPTTAFSISTWIKPTSLANNTNYNIFAKQEWSNKLGYRLALFGYGGCVNLNCFALGVGDSANRQEFYGSNGNLTNLNTWYHLIATFDSGAIKLYVNGNLTSQTTSIVTSISNTSGIAAIGRHSSGGEHFPGLIDEVKIYNYALTADQVKQDYNQNSSAVFGNTSQTIGATTTSLEYCLPGDTSPCSPPVGEWKFDEGVGTTAYDTSGNNNNAQLINSPTWTSGKIGKGINLNGSNNYISVPDTTSSILDITSAITIEAWVKNVGTTGNYNTILRKESSYALRYDTSGDLRGIIWIASTPYYSTSIPASTAWDTNNWNHYTLVYNGSKISLYKNGTKAVADTDASGSIDTNDNPLGLGANGIGSYKLSGLLDHIKIYNYARTPAQIAYDYNKGEPVGHWKMDECQGTLINDWSGNANHGTLSIGVSGTQTSPGTCTTSGAWYNGKLGKLNSSLNFDGSDDSLNIGNPSILNFGTNNFSYCYWLKTTSTSGQLVGKGTWNYDAWGSFITNNRARFEIKAENPPGTGANADSLIINDNQWHHLCGSYDRTGYLHVYTDGKLTNSANISSISTYNINNSLNFIVASGAPGYTSGQIDDVRIYNYALTPTQIKTLYNNGSVNFR